MCARIRCIREPHERARARTVNLSRNLEALVVSTTTLSIIVHQLSYGERSPVNRSIREPDVRSLSHPREDSVNTWTALNRRGGVRASETYTRIKSILTDSPLAPFSPFGPWNWYVKRHLFGKRWPLMSFTRARRTVVPESVSTKGGSKGAVWPRVSISPLPPSTTGRERGYRFAAGKHATAFQVDHLVIAPASSEHTGRQ